MREKRMSNFMNRRSSFVEKTDTLMRTRSARDCDFRSTSRGTLTNDSPRVGRNPSFSDDRKPLEGSFYELMGREATEESKGLKGTRGVSFRLRRSVSEERRCSRDLRTANGSVVRAPHESGTPSPLPVILASGRDSSNNPSLHLNLNDCEDSENEADRLVPAAPLGGVVMTAAPPEYMALPTIVVDKTSKEDNCEPKSPHETDRLLDACSSDGWPNPDDPGGDPGGGRRGSGGGGGGGGGLSDDLPSVGDVSPETKSLNLSPEEERERRPIFLTYDNKL